MTNTKSTKRALLASVMAMLLCFTMLLGTTFAWFTDSVTSGNNIIKSGTLDVEMYWADGTEAPDSATWTDASTGAIFNYDKWEPGYVEVRHIKIANEGTLALKYQIKIVANGEVSDLADVIDVYYVDPAQQIADRTELTADKKIGTLTEVLTGLDATASGELAANTADTITLALKMQESAGNEYQNKSIGSDFSVILMATQDNVEKDAFDENYDDIEIPEMHIENINGVTYGVGAYGNYYMISVDDYTLTTFTVDDKVTVLGTGDGENDNDRVFGKNAPLTSLTLPEGLTEIKDNALNALPNLTTVNLPSTLETIGIQSFRQTGMSEITVPASVETVKLGAFRDMANLTTVTVKGNVAFDNYAFRSCPSLTSIYLLGDDVTFTGGQFATHSDDGNATGITIYVKNTTVAARVYAAQTSAYGYEVKVLGAAADGSDADPVTQAKNATDLETAVANGGDVVMANDVTLTGKVITTNNVTEAYGNTVGVAQYGGTLDGNGNSLTETGLYAYVIVTHGGTIKNLTIVGGGRGIVIYAPTEDVIIDNVVIDGPGYAINTAEHNGQDLIVTNSTIKGWTSLAGLDSVSFTDCLFGENSTKYWQNFGYGVDYDRLIRPYGQASFTDCTFEKNFYIDLSSLANGNKVTLTNCICEGVVLTAENYANYITVELPDWATSIADCIVFN